MPERPYQCVQTRSAIWRIYRDAADEDYLLARFSARVNMLYQFWWNAQQSVEKYLKAALLLNGYEVSTYGHRPVGMFDVARSFSDSLIPFLHCPPRHVSSSVWPIVNSRGFENADKFVERLERSGDFYNRYRVNSTYTRPGDLVRYDELCFVLRCICFPLDLDLGSGQGTAREFLLRHRGSQLHPRLSFEGSMGKNYERHWREHFEWCNFAYFYDDAVAKGEYPHWGGAINAEPFMAIQSGDKNRLDAIKWIAEKVFPNRLRKAVLEAIPREPT